jgi:hypothetical protein
MRGLRGLALHLPFWRGTRLEKHRSKKTGHYKEVTGSCACCEGLA